MKKDKYLSSFRVILLLPMGFFCVMYVLIKNVSCSENMRPFLLYFLSSRVKGPFLALPKGTY